MSYIYHSTSIQGASDGTWWYKCSCGYLASTIWALREWAEQEADNHEKFAPKYTEDLDPLLPPE